MSAGRPLGHIRLVDLATPGGHMMVRMLASLGARCARVAPAGGEADAIWYRGVETVDPVEGDDSFERLLDQADILLRGPSPNAPDYRAGRPGLIEVVLGPFMPGGANEDRPATNLTLMARSGLMEIVGDPDRPPLDLPGEQAWALGGIQAAIGALVALHQRSRTGEGQRVEVSAYQATVLANYREPLSWAWLGRVGTRTGNLLVRGDTGVRQVWRARDGFVTWALVDNPPMMRAMVKAMGDQARALAEVDWDATLVADAPVEMIARWESEVAAFFAGRDRGELFAMSMEQALGLSPIDEVADVLASEHLAARRLWDEDGDLRLPGRLWVTSGEEA
jgi:crotonobetainyl-CoA:carnitine CoA-transferase CaiB-like acyl-CoA transferase